MSHPGHWKNGLRSSKPTSLVQGVFLFQLDSARTRWNYDVQSWVLAQIQKNRVASKVPINKVLTSKRKKDNVLKLAGLSKVSSKTTSSPHFVIHTTSKSGSEVGIIENRFYWQLSGKKSSSVAFSDLEPRGRESDFKILFSIRTGTPGKFCTDFDGFYPPSHPPEDKKFLSSWHPALALVPKGGNGIRLFNMDNGLKEGETFFKEGIVLEDVTCHESKMITLHCKKTSLAKEVLSEFFIFDFPPFQLQAHVQVMASSIKESRVKRGRVEMGVVFEDFLVLSYASKRMELYDLDQVLLKSKLEEADDLGVTHKVELLPDPLLTLTSEHLSHPHHLLFVVEVKEGLQIQGLTSNGLAPVLLEDGKENCFPSDSKIRLMKTAAIQIIVLQESTVKVFRVYHKCEEEGVKGNENYLKLEFEKSFLQEEECEEQKKMKTPVDAESLNSVVPRRTPRTVERKSYAGDIAVAIDFDENLFLNQVAIVRFAENSVSFFVYDSVTLELIYKVKVDHFRPKSTEVFDSVALHFSNQFLVVKRKGSSDSSLYVLNLLADPSVGEGIP